ncbi:hypothetical protein HYW61_02125 [candidate division WWE3 bacterium]|nr:hypothetical protein [candidate division WWE3 bacterium]
MDKSVFIFDPLDRNVLSCAESLNPSSVLVDSSKLNVDVVDDIRQRLPDVKIYAEVGVFAGEKLLGEFPDARPVEAFGKPTSRGRYVGVCPTHKGVREFALNKVSGSPELDVDGVWLDFIRYPTKWEEPSPYILDTCYCDRCIKMFEDFVGESVDKSNVENMFLHIDGSYYHEWLRFKTEQITSFVKETRALIGSKKLGLFVIPWDDSEYGAGIKRIIGQDFMALANYVDAFSPMLYHKMCGRDVSWIGEMVDYFWHVGKPFLPLIQTEPRIAEIGSDEFESALKHASKPPSSGVCIFFLDDLIKRPDNFEVAKDFFAQSN